MRKIKRVRRTCTYSTPIQELLCIALKPSVAGSQVTQRLKNKNKILKTLIGSANDYTLGKCAFEQIAARSKQSDAVPGAIVLAL
jgi:hypothetical protein